MPAHTQMNSGSCGRPAHRQTNRNSCGMPAHTQRNTVIGSALYA